MRRLLSEAAEYIANKRQKRFWDRIAICLACAVMFGTAYALTLPGITMEGTAYCGYEEHQHGSNCFEKQLICGHDAEASHVHTEDCYEEQQVLVCKNDETDHVHGPECYETQKVLACGYPEQSEKHVHTDACYEEVLVCEKTEHEHSLACYSNPDADVESQADWESTLSKLDLTGNWADDVLAVAKSQVGYEESTKNYQVADDEVIKGITRYGQWYGDPYGDWSAMFVSFCLSYAGVTDYPLDGDCQNWIDTLKEKEYDRYVSSDTYHPQPGDLIFLDTDDEKGADHVGIVTAFEESTETEPAKVSVIVGDADDCVQSIAYQAGDSQIVGYGTLPENPELTEKDGNTEQAEENEQEDSSQQDDSFALSAESEDGVSVSISGPESSLPFPAEEISVTVEAVTNEDASALVDAAVADTDLEDGQTYLFDVRLWHDGEEIEPTGPIELTFKGLTSAEQEKSAGVFHVDEENKKATDMNAEVSEDGDVVVDTDHFSIYAVVIQGEGDFEVTSKVSATWDQSTNSISAVTFTATNSDTDAYYQVQYRDENDENWTPIGDSFIQAKKGNTATLTLKVTDEDGVLASARMNRIFCVYATDKKGTPKEAYSTSVSLFDILDSIKAGFSEWLKNSYVQEFDGAEPTDTAALYVAFARYYAMPELTISTTRGTADNTMTVTATSDPAITNATYQWQYQDDNGNWQSLCDATTATVNVSEIAVLQNGGKMVRCKMYSGTELEAISDSILVNPRWTDYEAAIAAINTGLKDHFTYVTPDKKTSDDLSINGDIFTSVFYYGNVAADSGVPFYDAASYANYLAKIYIENGSNEDALEKVQEKWDYYLYDLYDPDWKTMDNICGDYPTPDAIAKGLDHYTMGDEGLGWPKASMSSFHGSATSYGRTDADGSIEPEINNLNYDFGEDDVDYSSFISDVKKTATAAAAGDANTDRKYGIDISADGTAKVDGPVAMIFQIQTSWQMFDMAHANAKLNQGVTKVGSVATNTELANLYAIKHALLDFVDYMKDHYRGNNLVLGITEVKHGDSTTMFGPTTVKDANTTGRFVTNDYDLLRQGIINWDSFGNCEHVHYDTNTLEAAANNISSNLSGWVDQNNQPLNDKVRKVGVIIGGPTENNANENGYACVLPWDTLNSKLNAVYSIRTNEGTSRNTTEPGNVISWLDYTDNQGDDKLNKNNKYVATTRQAIYERLIAIAEQEMKQNMINSGYSDKISVDDVILKDTIAAEFELDTTESITVTIKKTDGTGEPVVTEIEAKDLTIVNNDDGTTTVSYNVGTLYAGETAVLHFTVKAKEDYIGSNNVYTNKGTPSATYQHTNSKGTEKYDTVGKDTPQVNVPIRFDTVDGETANIIVGDSVDLATLSEEIVKDAEDRVDNYGQINGTLTYTWVLPDGTEVEAGSVTVTNGSIGEQTFPDRSQKFTGTTAGQYTGTLKVTFTPEDVDLSSGDFLDDGVTTTSVNALTKEGNVWINVVAENSKERFFVRKVWTGTPPEGTDSIKFHVLANGEAVLDENRDPLEYELSESNDWETVIDGLPSVKDGVIQNYTVEEVNAPEGYSATYSSESRKEDEYAAKVTLTFTPSSKIGNKALRITYTYNGQVYTYDTPKQDYEKDAVYSFVVENLPLDESGAPYACNVVSIVKLNNNGNVEGDAPISTSGATAEKYLCGSVNTEVKVITNAPAYELPETGGIGTSLYTLGGLLFLAAALLYGYKLRRKQERRFEA